MSLEKEPTYLTVRVYIHRFSILPQTQKKNTTRYRAVHVGVQHSSGVKGSMSENDRSDSFQRSTRVQGTRTVPRKRNSSSSYEKYSGTYRTSLTHLTQSSHTLQTFLLQEKDRLVPLFELRKVENKDEFKSSKSDYGLWCASKAGVNRHVLDRARYIFDSIDKSQAISALTQEDETTKPSKYRQLLIQFLSVDSWIDCSDDEVSQMFNRCCRSV